MHNINIRGLDICLYDNPDVLPITRFKEFQKYALIDSGVASDIDGINDHYSKFAAFLQGDKKKEALDEILNMRQSLWIIQHGINIKYLSFACLIHSLNGDEVTITEDGLNQAIETLSHWGVTNDELVEELEAVKKKSLVD